MRDLIHHRLAHRRRIRIALEVVAGVVVLVWISLAALAVVLAAWALAPAASAPAVWWSVRP